MNLKNNNKEKKIRVLDENHKIQDFKILLENIPDIISRFDKDLKRIYVNQSAEIATGISTDALIGKTHKELNMPEELANFWQENLKNVFKTGATEIIETSSETQDGIKHYQSYLVPEFGSDGKPQTVLVISRDITQLKKMQDELKKSEEEKTLVFDNVAEQILYYTSDMKILLANKEASLSAQMPQSEMIGKHCYKIWYKRDVPCDNCPVVITLKTGKSLHSEIKTPDGKFWSIRSSPVKNEKGEVVGAIESATDITEKKQLEENLYQAQKMEAIGQIAAGIAHQMNTPLAIIYTQLQILQDELEKEKNTKYFKQIGNLFLSLEKISSIIKNLLSFSRISSYEKEIVDINFILKEILIFIGTEAKKRNIKILKKYNKCPILVEVSRNKLEQAFLNIIMNAFDAMPDGGKLQIAINKIIKSNKKYVKISFSDTGEGMEKKVVENIFSPFFTTKQIGQGTGLGMYVSYNIIKEHNGSISVESKKGAGTNISVILPIKENK